MGICVESGVCMKSWVSPGGAPLSHRLPVLAVGEQVVLLVLPGYEHLVVT